MSRHLSSDTLLSNYTAVLEIILRLRQVGSGGACGKDRAGWGVLRVVGGECEIILRPLG